MDKMDKEMRKFMVDIQESVAEFLDSDLGKVQVRLHRINQKLLDHPEFIKIDNSNRTKELLNLIGQFQTLLYRVLEEYKED